MQQVNSEDLNNSDKGVLVVARRLEQSFTGTAGFVECYWYVVGSTCHQSFKEGQPVNQS